MKAYCAICLVLTLVALVILPAMAVTKPPAEPKADSPGKVWVFVGTYTGPKSKGIYRLEMDPRTGALSEPELAAESPSPSFLAIHPSHKFLFAVGEVGEFAGKKNTGGVVAFSLDPASGELKPLNRKASEGAGPCHLVVDSAGKHVLVANYGGGSAAVLPIGDDGKLEEASATVQHLGNSVNKARQSEPHAHSINLDKANHFAFVADLGLDRVMIYRFLSDKGGLAKNDPASVAITPGSGPRHFAFHPDGKHAYVINEMANTITVCDYDPDAGALTTTQTISTLPKTFTGDSSTAEVVVHPSGKFVYGSNRGQNSIAVFQVDPKTGKLTAAGHQGKDIKTPRNFNIDPSGKFLVVANQDGDSLIVFAIDQETGALEPTPHKAKVGTPVCVKFVEKK
jgi:6-phosphogluconolactonase